ncbi:protein LONGIFOLIA 1-like [Primulina tabacum]|uniref:protein LONGIFOLIA 1-like n=1 Tax=Primulina tabacum TaxID=48773 RepID=UPI003F596BBC
MAMGNEQNLEMQTERQMGCMAGFLQIFYRQHFLTGKRLYSTKRLPSSRVVDTTLDLEISAPSLPANSRELGDTKQLRSSAQPSPEVDVAELPPKSPLPLPVFNLRDVSKSSWNIYRDSPRLSLDSRATMDAKGGLHPKEIRTVASVLPMANRSCGIGNDYTSDGYRQRSPSVIARLMGLEPQPVSVEPELRRSASESRASRDIFHSRFVTEGGNTLSKLPSRSKSSLTIDGVKENTQLNADYEDPRDQSWKQSNKAALSKGLNRIGSGSPPTPWRASQHRKCLFDSADIFPEPKQTVSIQYGEVCKRLKMRGIDKPSKDLETLKQILEALQLKGLLHSNKPSGPNQANRRIFVYDESPIVLIRPSRLLTSTLSTGYGSDYSPLKGGNHGRSVRRHISFAGENSPSVNPCLERYVSSPTTRNEGSAKTRRPKFPTNPKPSSVGIQKRLNESTENQRVTPNQSPMRKPRITRPDQTANGGSHRSKKTASKTEHKEKITTAIVVADESSSISWSSFTTSTDTERSKTAVYEEGKNLLERCDKLLNSTAEMNETDTQPSPVSVLDSSFYKDESLTPSPVTTKRNLDFKDESIDLVEEIWSPVISPVRSKCGETLDDSDFSYISDVLRVSRCLSDKSDVFQLLEKQQHLKGKDTSKASRLQRKLIFDTTTEILDRNRQLPPWNTASRDDHNVNKSSLNKVWSEFQRIREPNTAQDLFGVICGVLKKDLSAGDATTSWADCPAEKSGAVLDMERMIFKDLIGETIEDLAALACRSSSMSCQKPRRKLVL